MTAASPWAFVAIDSGLVNSVVAIDTCSEHSVGLWAVIRCGTPLRAVLVPLES